MQNKIVQPLFDGRCAVRALWFDLALIGEAEGRRRVLAHWQTGARLFSVQGGYLLEWPSASWHRVDALDGLALCQVGHVLSSAPLSAAELSALAPGAYWLVRDASAMAAVPDARIDPAPWLDLSGIALREPLAFPRSAADPGLSLPDPVSELRAILGDAIPPFSTERSAFLRDAVDAARGGRPRKGAELGAAAGGAMLGVLGLLAGWVGSLLPARAGGAADGVPPATTVSPLARRLSALTVKLAMLTRVSKLLGWRQALYLRKMLDLFENGDFQEALRHAIPIDALDNGNLRQALGTPRARTSLDVTRPGAVGGAIGIDSALQQHLRATYRRTFERLDREGKIDEAVFVLAELLQCGAEAVTYLEKHKRYKQAAQLAATMELGPDIGVRLWVLAGDFKRAVSMARLHNQFEGAVRMLESRQHPDAGVLRRHWAEHLAARGDLAEAIDAVWPLPEHHPFALACLVQAERAGGTLGVRALARKLALLPGSLAASVPALTALLTAEGEDAVQLRARMAMELLALTPHSAATRSLAAALARQVVGERAAGLNQLDKNELNRLVALAESPMLRADMPALSLPAASAQERLMARSTPLELALAERGLLPIHDARALADGHYLLALGESGMVRIGRNGKQVAHYQVPAYHLVLADSGQRALALAKRDKSYRVSRLDLITGKVADWLLLPLTYWSDHYDGVTWNVALERRLAALDTHAAQLAISWQVADLPGAIVGYCHDGALQSVVLAAPQGLEQWAYAQPGRQLRQRESWDMPDSAMRVLPSPTMGAPYLLTLRQEALKADLVIGRCGSAPSEAVSVALGEGEVTALEVALRAGWILMVATSAQGSRCILATQRGEIKAVLSFPGSEAVRISVQGERILMFDRCGRLADIDTATGVLRTQSLS